MIVNLKIEVSWILKKKKYFRPKKKNDKILE